MNGEEIKLNNVNIPFGLNKDFMQKEGDNFIINSKGGGDFFPNKAMTTMIITALLSVITSSIFLFVLPTPQKVWVFAYLIFLVILFYVWFVLTSIKTTFIFSSNGIDIHSRKGSLFIQKKDIEDIYVETKERRIPIKGGEIVYKVYEIVITFRYRIYIPYTKESIRTANFLYEYDFKDDNVIESNSNKMFLEYIVQEIKKALEVRL